MLTLQEAKRLRDKAFSNGDFNLYHMYDRFVTTMTKRRKQNERTRTI